MSDDPNNTVEAADFDESVEPALTTSFDYPALDYPALDDHAPRTGADGTFTVGNDAASESAT